MISYTPHKIRVIQHNCMKSQDISFACLETAASTADIVLIQEPAFFQDVHNPGNRKTYSYHTHHLRLSNQPQKNRRHNRCRNTQSLPETHRREGPDQQCRRNIHQGMDGIHPRRTHLEYIQRNTDSRRKTGVSRWAI